jgi:metallo-beta-lactamase family protein
MRIVFAGAAQEVTGSCFYVEAGGSRFLVDCGLFQGSRLAEEKNELAFPFDASRVDFVILTHAHLDHCGRLPLLAKRGFHGAVYCTEPTVQLADIVLTDAAGLIADEAERDGTDPLWSEEDLERLRPLFKPLKYHQRTKVGKVEFELYDAGHILGSSFVQIQAEGKSLVFSGDLGNPPVPLLQTTEAIPPADWVIMESTYGNRRHEDWHLRKQRLGQAIKASVSQGGTLLIPTFAIERTQEVLHDINEIVHSGALPYIPIFLDSPMAIRATEVYRDFTDYYNATAVKQLATDEDLFSFPGLSQTMSSAQSKAINTVPPPKIIMAGSGMMQGGRILHHLKQYVDEPKCTLLIVGFLVETSIGRQLLDGARHVRIYGKEYPVRCKVQAIGAYSGHADQPKLLSWIGGLPHPPKGIFIAHGEKQSALDLAQSIRSQTGFTAKIPALFEEVILE